MGLFDGTDDGKLNMLLHLSPHDSQESSFVQLKWVGGWVVENEW
jgi:hypothetical protein